MHHGEDDEDDEDEDEAPSPTKETGGRLSPVAFFGFFPPGAVVSTFRLFEADPAWKRFGEVLFRTELLAQASTGGPSSSSSPWGGCDKGGASFWTSSPASLASSPDPEDEEPEDPEDEEPEDEEPEEPEDPEEGSPRCGLSEQLWWFVRLCSKEPHLHCAGGRERYPFFVRAMVCLGVR